MAINSNVARLFPYNSRSRPPGFDSESANILGGLEERATTCTGKEHCKTERKKQSDQVGLVSITIAQQLDALLTRTLLQHDRNGDRN
jgi:hypothetical protein